MHEMSLVTSLLDLIESSAKTHRLKGVSRVFLKVGALAMVEPMTLRAAFEVACEGSIAEGAEIVIEEVPVTCRCAACADDFAVARYDFACPSCGSDQTTVLTGKELSLDRLEAVPL